MNKIRESFTDKDSKPVDLQLLRESLFGENKAVFENIFELAGNLWLFYTLSAKEFFPSFRRGVLETHNFSFLSMKEKLGCLMSAEEIEQLYSFRKTIKAEELQRFEDFLSGKEKIQTPKKTV